MKLITIFLFIIPNLLWSNILNNFPLACICDKNINALKYFNCKQKVSGTQLNYDGSNFVYSTFDKKNYEIFLKSENLLELKYETNDYISTIKIDDSLELLFSILYKEYQKEWSYDLQCVSLKKE